MHMFLYFFPFYSILFPVFSQRERKKKTREESVNQRFAERTIVKHRRDEIRIGTVGGWWWREPRRTAINRGFSTARRRAKYPRSETNRRIYNFQRRLRNIPAGLLDPNGFPSRIAQRGADPTKETRRAAGNQTREAGN